VSRLLLEAIEVKKYYPVKTSLFKTAFVRAVDGISLKVCEGEVHCIVGESGSGKSTFGRLVAGLEEPTSGTLRFMNRDVIEILRGKNKKDLMWFRRNVQIVFQDPYSSLNPRKRIREILARPFKIHGVAYDESALHELLESVGLVPPREFLDRYPHQLSGGQRQRVAIARAIALRPKLVVLDEPTSALDVTVKAQILNLLSELRERESLTYILISHELPIVRSVCDSVTVMYFGRVVEQGSSRTVFERPLHPYTIGLLNSIPLPSPQAKAIELAVMEGEPPSPLSPPPGCRFHTRCPIAREDCKVEEPPLIEVNGGHLLACPVSVREYGSDGSEIIAKMYLESRRQRVP